MTNDNHSTLEQKTRDLLKAFEPSWEDQRKWKKIPPPQRQQIRDDLQLSAFQLDDEEGTDNKADDNSAPRLDERITTISEQLEDQVYEAYKQIDKTELRNRIRKLKDLFSDPFFSAQEYQDEKTKFLAFCPKEIQFPKAETLEQLYHACRQAVFIAPLEKLVAHIEKAVNSFTWPHGTATTVRDGVLREISSLKSDIVQGASDASQKVLALEEQIKKMTFFKSNEREVKTLHSAIRMNLNKIATLCNGQAIQHPARKLEVEGDFQKGEEIALPMLNQAIRQCGVNTELADDPFSSLFAQIKRDDQSTSRQKITCITTLPHHTARKNGTDAADFTDDTGDCAGTHNHTDQFDVRPIAAKLVSNKRCSRRPSRMGVEHQTANRENDSGRSGIFRFRLSLHARLDIANDGARLHAENTLCQRGKYQFVHHDYR